MQKFLCFFFKLKIKITIRSKNATRFKQTKQEINREKRQKYFCIVTWFRFDWTRAIRPKNRQTKSNKNRKTKFGKIFLLSMHELVRCRNNCTIHHMSLIFYLLLVYYKKQKAKNKKPLLNHRRQFDLFLILMF